MASRLFPSNDGAGYGYAYHETIHTFGVDGNVTADDLGNVLLQVPDGWSGTIVSAVGRVGTNGEDGTDPLQMAFNVKINGTTIFTTQPVIAKAAGTGAKNTSAAGTGITVGVIDTTADAVAENDLVTVDFDITRTTPETEIANVSVSVVIRWDARSN